MTRIAPNIPYTWADVSCPGTGLVRLSSVFWQHMERLARFRQARGVDTPILRGYIFALDSPDPNEAQHVLSYLPEDERFATDMAILEPTKKGRRLYQEVEVAANIAERMGFTGIGLYDNHVHLDLRQWPARWDKRSMT